MTRRDVELVIVGGGVAALWLARLAVGAGLRTALVTAGPMGSHASTRNQGWLHSGGFYAAYAASALAGQCAAGSADVRALARGVPGLLSRQGGGVFLARDAEHAAAVSTRLSDGGIEHRLLLGHRWSRPGLVLDDCAIDTRLLIDALAHESLRRGATVVTGPVEAPPGPVGDGWSLRAGGVTVRGQHLVLALGAGLPRRLRSWGLDSDAPRYAVTRTRVLVAPGVDIRVPVIPLFDAGPTVVPVWHQGRHHGVTICLPFDNTADHPVDDTADRHEPDDTGLLLDECVDRLPGLAGPLTPAVRAEAWSYRCEKLVVAGQQHGTAASRSYRVDPLADGMTAFYAGKLTTASVGAGELVRSRLGHLVRDARMPASGEVLGGLHTAPRAAVDAGAGPQHHPSGAKERRP